MAITFDLAHEEFGVETSEDCLDQRWLELAKINLGEDSSKK